jgi:UDP-N-acetylglucosamine--N-acetylmuramyl-(pentapeptide) pyrophosphoryl-undecaprenol N-acetylglucosamine transferase
MNPPLILLCAGGTGGHMMPARSLANELLKRGCRVALACDARGRKFFDDMPGVDIHVLATGSPRAGKIGFILSLLKAFGQTQSLISRLKPSVAVGFGGYPSAPPIFACQIGGVPTILHEQNAILGLANKILAPLATRIALSHRDTVLREQWKRKAVFTGNPVRSEIVVLANEPYPDVSGKINLLIFAGSLGAKIFSDLIPGVLKQLPADIKNRLEVVQQAREEDMEAVKAAYAGESVSAEISPFFSDMPERLKKAHLLICRSGGTVTEATIAGRPAIYIPYPWHKDQQQLHNARQVVNAGGGWLMEEKNLTPESLLALLNKMLSSPNLLIEAAQKARNLGKPDAARHLADLIFSLSPRGRGSG